VRESGKPFAFVLNQVQARSARLNGAAGSLGNRAIALKMSHVLAVPAIVLRNDQQDALGIGLGRHGIRAPRKVGGGDPRAMAMALGAAKLRLAARRGSAGPHACTFARRGPVDRCSSGFAAFLSFPFGLINMRDVGRCSELRDGRRRYNYVQYAPSRVRRSASSSLHTLGREQRRG